MFTQKMLHREEKNGTDTLSGNTDDAHRWDFKRRTGVQIYI
jgi:hypothetical protein